MADRIARKGYLHDGFASDDGSCTAAGGKDVATVDIMAEEPVCARGPDGINAWYHWYHLIPMVLHADTFRRCGQNQFP